MTNVLSRPVMSFFQGLRVPFLTPREDHDNYYIVWWCVRLLEVIRCSRTITADGKYIISDKMVAKIIENHGNTLPLGVTTWLTPQLLMKHLRFVPIKTDKDGTWWMEPCLTKRCEGRHRDGTPCNYGHPGTTVGSVRTKVSKADASGNWRKLESYIPQNLFEEVDAEPKGSKEFKEPKKVVWGRTAISPFPPPTIEKQRREIGYLVYLIRLWVYLMKK